MSIEKVKQFINSVPDKRVAIQILNALAQLTPTNTDTALTAHAGGGQSSALDLRSDCAFHDITTVASAADSVALPYPHAGDIHVVKNSAAANSAQVYAVTPGTIDSVATGTGVPLPAGTAALFACVVDGNYVRIAGVPATVVAAFGGVTAGTVTASKVVVVDSNKDIGDFRNLDVVNLDAGASGTAGSVDVFPATATKGKLTITCTDQTGNTTVSVVADAMGAARTITLRDPGAAASLLTTTDATAAATTATAAEISAVVAGNTATAAEITRVADVSARIVATTATALNLTVTQHAERVVLVNSNSTFANTFSLPAATGSGAKFTIVNNIVQTQGTVVVAANGTDVINGVAHMFDTTSAVAEAFFTSATSDKVSLNLTTTGGLGGDEIEVWDVAANTWRVKVAGTGSGTLATPFSQT